MAFGTVFRNFNSALRAHGFIFRDGRRTLGVKVINKSGSDIAPDKLVAISGFDVTSKLMKIVLADADAVGLATEVFVTRATIHNNAMGHVYKGFSSVNNIDTSSVNTVGDPLYLSTTAGAFATTAPTGPNARQVIVGYSTIKSASVGRIAWDIHDVDVIGTNDIQSSFTQTITGTIASTDITGTSAGQFGHTNGYILVPAPGAGKAIIIDNVVASYVFATAAYTGGGNTTVNIGGGGAALTGLISAANFAAAASSKPVAFYPLSTAGVALTANTPLNLVTTAAFTQPGTAAGVINYSVTYNVVTL